MTIKEFCSAALEALKDDTQPREFGRVLAKAQADTGVRDIAVGALVNRGYRGDYKDVESLRSTLEKMGNVARPAPLPVAEEEKVTPIDVTGSFGVDPKRDDHVDPSPLTREEKKRRRMEAEEA